MTTAEQYKKFEELDKQASLGGGVDRIEKQHANGHMTARERKIGRASCRERV